jgi:biopolymer transport protein ExbD
MMSRAPRLCPRPPRSRAEPTIALINIVFLMLVFFLVAGQIARPLDRTVELVTADLAAARVPEDALVLRADGALLWRGAPTTPEAFAAAHPEGPLRLLPDRNVPAADLVAVAAALRGLAGQEVRLVTKRGLAP